MCSPQLSCMIAPACMIRSAQLCCVPTAASLVTHACTAEQTESQRSGAWRIFARLGPLQDALPLQSRHAADPSTTHARDPRKGLTLSCVLLLACALAAGVTEECHAAHGTWWFQTKKLHSTLMLARFRSSCSRRMRWRASPWPPCLRSRRYRSFISTDRHCMTAKR